jgi:nucleoside-diphosphate-sugar epimerase
VTIRTYTVALANSFDARSPEEAVSQMVAYAIDAAPVAGYRVTWDEDGTERTTFIDAEDVAAFDIDALDAEEDE